MFLLALNAASHKDDNHSPKHQHEGQQRQPQPAHLPRRAEAKGHCAAKENQVEEMIQYLKCIGAFFNRHGTAGQFANQMSEASLGSIEPPGQRTQQKANQRSGDNWPTPPPAGAPAELPEQVKPGRDCINQREGVRPEAKPGQEAPEHRPTPNTRRKRSIGQQTLPNCVYRQQHQVADEDGLAIATQGGGGVERDVDRGNSQQCGGDQAGAR